MNRLVYCNNCFSNPSRTSLFFVTTCAHIYCQTCKEDCTRNACKMCGETCSTTALSENMSQDVRELFKDPKDILQRALMVSDFQVSQLVRLSTYLKQEVQTLRANQRKATELGLKYKQCKRGGYTVLRPVLLNESGVEAFREALVRDKAWSETPGPEDTLQHLCTACEDFWIDFMDLCKKQAESLRKEVAALKNELAKHQQKPGNAARHVGASPGFLTRDYRKPPAFGETGVFPPSRQDSSSSGVFSMPTPVSQKKHRATSSEPTPSRRATAMVATMGLSRSSSGSQRGNHGNVTLMTPVYQRFSPASGRRRSPLQPGMSLSMSSIFNTPSTAASRYSTGMAPHATPVDVGARSRAYFNPSIPVRNERF